MEKCETADWSQRSAIGSQEQKEGKTRKKIKDKKKRKKERCKRGNKDKEKKGIVGKKKVKQNYVNINQ